MKFERSCGLDGKAIWVPSATFAEHITSIVQEDPQRAADLQEVAGQILATTANTLTVILAQSSLLDMQVASQVAQAHLHGLSSQIMRL